jgi:hypothetical protein
MRYSGLDPYACKAAFDIWIAEKPEERRPRYYDKAFLGFAAKWCKGKV